MVRSPYEIEDIKNMIDRVHGYIFVYDSSNKRTFTSMMCMLETIVDLENSKRKSQGKGGGKAPPKFFYPKKIVVGNKKDLRRNKEAGIIGENDIKMLGDIRIKEVSALTNWGISEVLKLLVTDMNNDKSFDKVQEKEYNKRLLDIKNQGKTQGNNEDEQEADNDIGNEKEQGGTIKHDDAKGGQGFFSCCGPREDEFGSESDSDAEKKSDDDSDDGDKDKKKNAEDEQLDIFL